MGFMEAACVQSVGGQMECITAPSAYYAACKHHTLRNMYMHMKHIAA